MLPFPLPCLLWFPGAVWTVPVRAQPPSSCRTASCWAVFLCQFSAGFPAFPLCLNEAPVPRHFLLSAAFMEFRERRCWEVRRSSEECKRFGKKNVLISTYLKNRIRNWKKQQERLCCYVMWFAPKPFQSWRHWASCYLRWEVGPIYKNIGPGAYLFRDSTALHSSFYFVFVLLFERII